MWWDGLTPEQVKDRLRKEGVFTPLLEAIRRDDPLLEEAMQQVQLTPEEELELMRSAVEDILLPWLDRMIPPKTGS